MSEVNKVIITASKCDECEYNTGFFCNASAEKYAECSRDEQRKDIEDAEKQ